jgi:hypothetical protein
VQEQLSEYQVYLSAGGATVVHGEQPSRGPGRKVKFVDEVERAQLQEVPADEELVEGSTESYGQRQQGLDGPELKKTILQWFLWCQHEVREALRAVLGFEPSKKLVCAIYDGLHWKGPHARGPERPMNAVRDLCSALDFSYSAGMVDMYAGGTTLALELRQEGYPVWENGLGGQWEGPPQDALSYLQVMNDTLVDTFIVSPPAVLLPLVVPLAFCIVPRAVVCLVSHCSRWPSEFRTWAQHRIQEQRLLQVTLSKADRRMQQVSWIVVFKNAELLRFAVKRAARRQPGVGIWQSPLHEAS